MPSKPFSERIVTFLREEGYQPKQIAELALAMGIAEGEQDTFHAAYRALMRTGRIALGAGDAVLLNEPPGKVVGIFRGNPRGFGFIIPDTPNAHGDLYVPAGSIGDAITGDTVSARVLKRGRRRGKMLYEGRIVTVLKRGQSRFVGELKRQAARWFVVPDGNALHAPIRIADAKAKRGKVGDQVVVEMVQYPSAGREARGVLVKVLGRRGEPGVDTLSIIAQHQLPGEFEPSVLSHAREVVDAYDPHANTKGRENLSRKTIITIDPEDARDFDDAISLSQCENGAVELGVHIADVAYFVQPGTALDKEARERSNSIYLPGTVIPMLPEVLSNGVCSLQERQPRLTKSVFIRYDRRGRVKATRAANTVIQSSKRLTYEQASRILDGKPGRTSAKVVALLQKMETLARLIRLRRVREGMLELDLPEVKPVWNEEGEVVDVTPADRSFSHKMIEMFMVEANEAVARILTGAGVPFLRRIHEDPDDPTEGNLQRLLRALGYDLPDGADRFALQKLLNQVRGKQGAFAVNLAVLRSMSQAEYSPQRVGHYALASTEYTHFTSPIRRYPDLTIHRLLDAFLAGTLKSSRGRQLAPGETDLIKLGRLCSGNERRAEAAERELKLVLILRLLEERIGEEFDGVVTGIANIGLFVQLEPYLVDGLLPFGDLADDWWEIDPSRGSVIGQRSGRSITVGDRLKVVVSRVHLPMRQLHLALGASHRWAKQAKDDKKTKGKHRNAKPLATGRGSRGYARKAGSSKRGRSGNAATARRRSRRH